jgi:outer membrane biogenesis lipoprotein LolB
MGYRAAARFSWLLLVLVLLSACRSKKAGTATESVSANRPELLVWQEIQAGDLTTAEFSLSGDLRFDINGNSQASAFAMRIEKGKRIWIVLRPMLGIEAFRALITPDSILITDRINKQYYEKPFAYLNQLAGTSVHYAELENLLLNNIGHLPADSLRLATNKNFDFELTQNDRFYQFKKQADAPKNAQLLLESGMRSLMLMYGQPSRVDENWVPSTIEIRLNGDENNRIQLNFSKFAVENGQSYPYTVPKSYQRVD